MDKEKLKLVLVQERKMLRRENLTDSSFATVLNLRNWLLYHIPVTRSVKYIGKLITE